MESKGIIETLWFKMLIVTIFALAMGFLETAVVVYLRALFNIVGEYQMIKPNPDEVLIALPFFTFLQPHNLFTILPDSKILGTDLFREIATIVMLLSFGWLVGKTLKGKIAIFLYTFAVWDISYYVFLYLILGWPPSLKTIDVLFLIPVPWVAPVFIPITISVLMIIISLYLLKQERKLE